MTHPHRHLARIVCICLLVAWGPATLSAADSDVVATIKPYTSWTRVTREPYRMAPAVNVLCAAPVTRQENPHADAFVHVYVNDLGRAAMVKSGQVTFPEGTVIVKEKRQAADDSEPVLLTVMVKRAKGYNPEVGDWEFAVTDGKGASVEEQGRIASCMQCHKTKAASDYVFRSYLTDAR